MKIKNAVLWRAYTAPKAWLASCAIVLVAFGIRYMLQPIVEPYGVFHLFTLSCLMIQYLFGYKFSSPAIVVAVLLGEYYFVEPYGTFDSIARKDILIAVQFLLVTGLAVFFMEKLRRESYSRELVLKVLESRHKTSLLRENDRIFYAKKSSDHWAILEELVEDYDITLFFVYGTSDYKIRPLFYRLATRFKLNDPVDQWTTGLHSEDIARLQAWISDEDKRTTLDLRLLQDDGTEHPVSVVADHFRFMGKQLSVVKLASLEEDQTASSLH